MYAKDFLQRKILRQYKFRKMVRRTKDDALQTRNKILNAAERVFYRHGVARTSMQQVATAAKVTRGAIYWHFADKLALLEAMVDRVFLPHDDVLANMVSKDLSAPLEELHTASLATFRHIAMNKQRQRVMTIIMHRCEHVDDLAPLLHHRQECKEGLYSQFLIILEKARQRKQLDPLWSPELAARALQALMTGLIMNSLENEDKAYYQQAEHALDSFFSTLRRK